MILREKFPKGMKVFQIPLSWFRRVTAWINNFGAGKGVKVFRPEEPSPAAPVLVSIDEEWLDAKIRNSTLNPDNLGPGTGAGEPPVETGQPSATDETADIHALNNDFALDAGTWEADSTHAPLQLTVFTRVFEANGFYYALAGRTLEFSPNGRLLSVSAENIAYRLAR